MAPEQIKGLSVGPYSDVYSTALLLWELLAGRRIYDDITVGQLMMRVANAEVPRISTARAGLPVSLHGVFSRAVALDPQDRFPSARAFAEALDTVVVDLGVERCQREVSGLVRAARLQQQQRGVEQAMLRARYAAARDPDDLELALLKALEDPDRIERVPIDWERLRTVDVVDVRSTMVDSGEPPTHPMLRAL